MRDKMFSILVVSLNASDKLKQTIESILEQDCTDYEVVVKDGGSKDGSVETLEEFVGNLPEVEKERIRIIRQSDKSIYEGMNQATDYAKGEYYYFLNCGDIFHEKTALTQVALAIRKEDAAAEKHLIYYGNIYDVLRGQVVQSNPVIDDFACYRNVPCHQACIYHYSLFEERGYETQYRVRGDYEHFLWSYFQKEANPQYVDVVLAAYEGGGFSETKENRERSAKEHKEITEKYMSKGQLFKYKLILAVTLAPLRTHMAESQRFAGMYQSIKKLIYKQSITENE